MKLSYRLPLFCTVAAAFLSCQLARAEEGFRPMFNANDFKGWVNANCAPETWSIKDGVISCTGKPIGALRTEKQYKNFILEAEWRHLSEGGNSGIFVWGTPISAPGVPFLRGIEVQVLDHGYLKKADPKKPKWFSVHGDVFPIHGATMEPHGEHSGMRSFPSEERSKPSPEWNHYRVEGINGKITLAVNGKVVSGGDNCNYRKGYLALESEGAPVEFRNVRIKELPSTQAGPEVTAPVDQGWQALYNGVDFRGWKMPEGESPWSVADWQIKLAADKAGPPLWSTSSYANAEVIVDVNLPKNARFDQALAGLCVRGNSRPLVVFGQGDASLVLGADKIKAGQWYRIRATLNGNKAKILITEPAEANPQSFEVTLPASDASEGPIGLSNLGQATGYANVYVSPLGNKGQ